MVTPNPLHPGTAWKNSYGTVDKEAARLGAAAGFDMLGEHDGVLVPAGTSGDNAAWDQEFDGSVAGDDADPSPDDQDLQEEGVAGHSSDDPESLPLEAKAKMDEQAAYIAELEVRVFCSVHLSAPRAHLSAPLCVRWSCQTVTTNPGWWHTRCLVVGIVAPSACCAPALCAAAGLVVRTNHVWLNVRSPATAADQNLNLKEKLFLMEQELRLARAAAPGAGPEVQAAGASPVASLSICAEGDASDDDASTGS